MTYKQDEQGYTLRFERGEEFVAGLNEFVGKYNIRGGWVIGLGGLHWAELGFYDPSVQEYSWTKFDELLELSNVTGNISWQDNKPALHLHATIADASFHASAGHLRAAEVAGTVEIFIYTLANGTELKRAKDESTGLNLLEL